MISVRVHFGCSVVDVVGVVGTFKWVGACRQRSGHKTCKRLRRLNYLYQE